MNAAESLAKVTGSTGVTVIHETRNLDGTLTVHDVQTTEKYDLPAAWRFVSDSYGDWSVDRCEWTDTDILVFVQQWHVTGLEAFKL